MTALRRAGHLVLSGDLLESSDAIELHGWPGRSHGSTAVRQARDVLRVIAAPGGPQFLRECQRVADTAAQARDDRAGKKNCAGRVAVRRSGYCSGYCCYCVINVSHGWVFWTVICREFS
jgi:hypothetical protein